LTARSRVALATLVCVAGAGPGASVARGETPDPGQTPSALTLEARDETGRQVSALHTGERLVLHGTVTPAVLGEPIAVSVALGTRPLLEASARIDSVDADGVGTFRTSLRPTRGGELSAVARRGAGGATSAPLGLPIRTLGRARAGCQGPVALTGLAASRPPRATGGRLRRGALLEPGVRLVVPDNAAVQLRRDAVSYRVVGGRILVECRGLTVRLPRGRGAVTSSAYRGWDMRTVAGDVVRIGAGGLVRMDTWPFSKPSDQRRLDRGAVPPYWADGTPCARGCRPRGARTGWPLKPFHRPHPLRSGLNEWRPANLHIGVDIQALDGTRVYAIQSGYASVAGVGTVDSRVRVGSYEYWHVEPLVHAGQYVHAHRTVIGRIIRGAGHLHLSELGGGYLNPLRPGGRVLSPYADTEEPVVGAVKRFGGSAFVEAFDPQSHRETIKYRTPVLAPAAVAWRARDARGRALSELRFAYRGSHHYPSGAKSVLYGPGTSRPDHAGAIAGGWACFWRFRICVPTWNYRLSGVPSRAVSLSIYVWDWAGNVARRTSPLP
jgi:hypothetical protein